MDFWVKSEVFSQCLDRNLKAVYEVAFCFPAKSTSTQTARETHSQKIRQEITRKKGSTAMLQLCHEKY